MPGPTAATFRALETFDRPATRRELEVETGLPRIAVEGALRVLRQHSALIADVHGTRRGLYSLAPGAVCPPERGQWKRPGNGAA